MLEVMATLLVIIAVGYVAGKMGYFSSEVNRQLSRIVINITCPALILSSAMTGVLPDRKYILPLLLISFISYVILIALGLFIPKLITQDKTLRGVMGFSMIFGNVGFMGYPVVASLFGYDSVFYAAVLNVVNTLAVFTVGTLFLTGNKGLEKGGFEKKILYSTPMIAAYITIAIVALGIDNIPSFISQPLTTLGNFTIPAALLIIGASISSMPVKSMFNDATVYIVAALRLAIMPIVVFLITSFLHFSEFVISINMLVIAMPVATYGTILCLKYKKNTSFITKVTFVTTLLSIFTIPLLTRLFLRIY